MEVVDQFRGIFQGFCRFPGEFIITNPADKVLQILADKFGVKDFFNLTFDVVVDNYYGGAGCFCPTSGLVAAGSRRDTWNTG